ncbi:MAG: ABC transporter substrate-binding protein [Pseudonocardiaceae bacterium]
MVTVGVNEQDFMLALGVVPVVITRFRAERYPGEIYPWAQDELGDAAPPQALTWADAGYQFEEIARLRPDLILGLYSPMTQEDYDTLAKIAPTVAQPVAYPDFGVPWQEMTRIIGRVFGKAERAEELVANIEARFAQVRAEHPEFEGQTALMAFPSFTDGTYFLYGPDDTRARTPLRGWLRPALGTGRGHGRQVRRQRQCRNPGDPRRRRADLVGRAGGSATPRGPPSPHQPEGHLRWGDHFTHLDLCGSIR